MTTNSIEIHSGDRAYILNLLKTVPAETERLRILIGEAGRFGRLAINYRLFRRRPHRIATEIQRYLEAYGIDLMRGLAATPSPLPYGHR